MVDTGGLASFTSVFCCARIMMDVVDIVSFFTTCSKSLSLTGRFKQISCAQSVPSKYLCFRVCVTIPCVSDDPTWSFSSSSN